VGALRGNSLYAWGKNNSGQLGNDSTTNLSDPQQIISNKKWTSISFGGDFSGGLELSVPTSTPTATAEPTATPTPTPT